MTINEKFTEYAKLKMMLEELRAEISTLESDIKASLEEAPDKKIIGNQHKAWLTESTGKRFDSKALEKAAPDVYNLYLAETKTTRFYFK